MIKAIETVYKGYRFRSRLEARWAVLFDSLGLKWEYEKEGFDLGDAGWYLPDFWIPELMDMVIEIKPNTPTGSEIRKCDALAWEENMIMIVGSPWRGEYYILDFNDTGKPIMRSSISELFDNWWMGKIDQSQFEVAYQAARSARFEHGEHGGSR